MLGIKLKEFRQKKSLTQLEVSKDLGVSDAHIVYIEKGTRPPSYKILSQMINIYGLNKEETLDILQLYFEYRLPEELHNCKTRITELTGELLTESQLDDYMDNLPNSLGPLLRDPIIINMLSVLKLIDSDKRKSIVGDMASLCQLEDDKFTYNMQFRCILHKLTYDKLVKALEMLKIFL